MRIQLNDIEARIIGCLIEKSIVTPDQYPLTLNALTNACNQKSSRDPMMSLTQGQVQHTIRELENKHLVRTEENFKSRVEKYVQRFCNTRYSDLQFSDAELAPFDKEVLLAYDFAEAKSVLQQYREFVAGAPDELSVWTVLREPLSPRPAPTARS